MAGILIDLPVEQVWDAISDPTRHVEWSAHSKTEELDEGPPSVGSRYHSHPPGKDKPDELTITEFKPDKRIAFRSSNSATGMSFDFTATLESRGDATYVTRDAVLVEGPFFLKPLIKLVISPRKEGAYLKVIKEALVGA